MFYVVKDYRKVFLSGNWIVGMKNTILWYKSPSKNTMWQFCKYNYIVNTDCEKSGKEIYTVFGLREKNIRYIV